MNATGRPTHREAPGVTPQAAVAIRKSVARSTTDDRSSCSSTRSSSRARSAAAADPPSSASALTPASRISWSVRASALGNPGSLATAHPARKGTLRAKVLVCIGEADPFVSKDERAAFRREMTGAAADFELVEYPRVQHGFTVKAATERGKSYGLPLAYDAQADQDSWSRLVQFLERSLA